MDRSASTNSHPRADMDSTISGLCEPPSFFLAKLAGTSSMRLSPLDSECSAIAPPVRQSKLAPHLSRRFSRVSE